MSATVSIRQLAVFLFGVSLLLAGCEDGNPTAIQNSGARANPSTSSLPSPTTGSATISWEAPTENTNGTALTDLSGFRIYCGTDATHLTPYVTLPNPGLLLYVIDGLPVGARYFFAVTALAADGEESGRSAIVEKTIT
jgi:hypothetical protein